MNYTPDTVVKIFVKSNSITHKYSLTLGELFGEELKFDTMSDRVFKKLYYDFMDDYVRGTIPPDRNYDRYEMWYEFKPEPKPKDSGVTFKWCYDNTVQTFKDGSFKFMSVLDALTYYPHCELTQKEFCLYDEYNRTEIMQDCCESYWESVKPKDADLMVDDGDLGGQIMAKAMRSQLKDETIYATPEMIDRVRTHPILQAKGYEGTLKKLYVVSRSTVKEESFFITPLTDINGNLYSSYKLSRIAHWGYESEFNHLDYTCPEDWDEELPKTETQLYKSWFSWCYDCAAKSRCVVSELPGFKSKHRGGTKGYWYDVASVMKVRLSNRNHQR